MIFVRTISEGQNQPIDAIKMLKLAGKQIEMDRILTETDSIDEISCLFDYFTYLQRKVTRQKQVGFGKKPNRIIKF